MIDITTLDPMMLTLGATNLVTLVSGAVAFERWCAWKALSDRQAKLMRTDGKTIAAMRVELLGHRVAAAKRSDHARKAGLARGEKLRAEQAEAKAVTLVEVRATQFRPRDEVVAGIRESGRRLRDRAQ